MEIKDVAPNNTVRQSLNFFSHSMSLVISDRFCSADYESRAERVLPRHNGLKYFSETYIKERLQILGKFFERQL